MRLKNKLKKLLLLQPKPFVDFFYFLYYRIKYFDAREKRISLGDNNKDIEFYVIRPRPNTVEGLMALLLYVLQHISYAEIKGYHPVVDFKNYSTQYNDEDKTNAWEYFFRQIGEWSLDDIYNSKNVILSGIEPGKNCSSYIRTKSFKTENILFANRLIQKYIQVSDDVMNLYRLEKHNLDIGSKLGVYLRGTDYTRLKPAGEPVQPSVEEAISIIERYIRNEEYSGIFLVTEDQEIYDKMLCKYGDFVKTVSYDTFISSYCLRDFLANDRCVEELDPVPNERGKKYLVKIMLLSQCRRVISGKTCGSWAACAFSGNVEKFYLFDLGNY